MTPCKNCGLWFLMSDEHGNLSYKQANGPTVERVRKQRLVQGPTRDMNPLWTGTRTMWSNLRVLKKVIDHYSNVTQGYIFDSKMDMRLFTAYWCHSCFRRIRHKQHQPQSPENRSLIGERIWTALGETFVSWKDLLEQRAIGTTIQSTLHLKKRFEWFLEKIENMHCF